MTDAHSKLVTTVVSTFTSYYIYLWSKYFPDKPLSPPLPSFDGRAVCYPTVSNLRDYMSWRQADCKTEPAHIYASASYILGKLLTMAGHINNLFNTTFWALVHDGMTNQEAEKELAVRDHYLTWKLMLTETQGSLSADKNEILFSRFGVNYNNEPEIFKKGSVIFRDVCVYTVTRTSGP